MPILVGAPAPTSAPRSRPTVTRIGAAYWTWTTVHGVRPLSDGATYLRPGGVVGHLSAPRVARESQPPTLDGSVYRGQRFLPRDIGLSLVTTTRSTLAFRDEYRELVRDAEAGGVLQVAHADGDTRMLQARYVSGLESPDGGDPGALTVGYWTVQLRADDPWWYGPVVSRTFTVSTVASWFPGPPFTINPSELVGSGSLVNNPGDVEAYPVWTVTGPCSSVTATAEDGSSWTVTTDLTAGDTVTVDCDPRVSGNAKIVDSAGVNLWGTATSDYPNLWALPAGESTVTVDMVDGSSESSVGLAFNPRYRTA